MTWAGGTKLRGPWQNLWQRRKGPRSGLVRVTVYFTPEQLAAVHAEARERADQAGLFRPDASAVIRDAVDLLLARRGK